MGPSPEQAIASLRAVSEYAQARGLALESVQALVASGSAGTDEHALALMSLSRLHDDLGDYGSALRTLDEAAEVAAGLTQGRRLVAIALARQAGIYGSLARMDEAERAMARALAMTRPPLEPGEPWWIEVFAEAAMLRTDRGDLDAAGELVGKALEAAERMPDSLERDRVRAHALNAAGTLERMRGEYDLAEGFLRRALAVSERCSGPRSIEVVEALNNLGICFKFSGRFDDGEIVYRRALDILERTFGDAHPDVASLYHNLGGLAHARGDDAAAEPYARRSVEIRERNLGADNPVTALDRAAHAAILDRLGRSEEAEGILRSVLLTLTATLGTDNHEVAAQFNNLAAIVQRRGALDEAEALYRQALAIKERVLGPRSPELAITLNNLATVLRARGEYPEAERLYRRALAILEASVEPSHPNLAVTRRNLAKLDRLQQAAQVTGEP